LSIGRLLSVGLKRIGSEAANIVTVEVHQPDRLLIEDDGSCHEGVIEVVAAEGVLVPGGIGELGLYLLAGGVGSGGETGRKLCRW
jgi:hypothetical protein